jgi:hypothetical protein
MGSKQEFHNFDSLIFTKAFILIITYIRHKFIKKTNKACLTRRGHYQELDGTGGEAPLDHQGCSNITIGHGEREQVRTEDQTAKLLGLSPKQDARQDETNDSLSWPGNDRATAQTLSWP